MEWDINILRERLEETLSGEPQTTVAEKIGRSQGAVSKLRSFSKGQVPHPDTLFNIAKAYNVSVDWLLGLSERKRLEGSAIPISYASVVKNLVSLCLHQMSANIDETGTGLVFTFDDPIIRFLVKKGLGLSEAGMELYQN